MHVRWQHFADGDPALCKYPLDIANRSRKLYWRYHSDDTCWPTCSQQAQLQDSGHRETSSGVQQAVILQVRHDGGCIAHGAAELRV